MITDQSPRAVIHASPPTYELHSLGWRAFQQLCASIVSDTWGQTVQGFFDSHDGGRDGAFYGAWEPNPKECYTGSFTVQCKSSLKSDKVLRLSDLRVELVKAQRLASRGLCNNYFLFTTGRLTGKQDEEIRDAFLAVPGIKAFSAYGVERISQFINESARLRMLVPRIYGLGDLSQILDERAYSQARDILSSLGDDLEKFVITGAYRRAQRAIVKHGFVLLLGEPACGKSMIAAALALGALDNWGCFTIKARDADDLVGHWNPNEPKQFFWVDDAFGATQCDSQGTIRWNATFPHIQAAIHRGARFVFTSRSYIYKSARNLLKESALPIMRESQVVIEVKDITPDERQQILYNHIRMGTQAKTFKTRIKCFLPGIAMHEGFGPETARRLGNPAFTKNLMIQQHSLDEFVARPMDHLIEVLRTLDSDSRAAIALVFIRGGNLPSPIDLAQTEQHALALLDSDVGKVTQALKALEGSLLLQVKQKSMYSWRFKHPTVRDAFAALIIEDRELLDIYLAGTPVPRLFQEVSCGDVGIQGVKVIVPVDRYNSFLKRISAYFMARHDHEPKVHDFLAYRCDARFLAAFLVHQPDFLKSLHIYSYLYAVSAVAMVARLHENGLLPEDERLRHIHTIRELAAETPDSGIFRSEVKRLFSEDEFSEMIHHVRSALVDNLDDVIDTWADNWESDHDPEDHFSELKSALNEFKEEFDSRSDEEAISRIGIGLIRIDRIIQEKYGDMPAEPDYDNYRSSGPVDEQSGRSVFDDVDA